jgi:hypothetical protein
MASWSVAVAVSGGGGGDVAVGGDTKAETAAAPSGLVRGALDPSVAAFRVVRRPAAHRPTHPRISAW